MRRIMISLPAQLLERRYSRSGGQAGSHARHDLGKARFISQYVKRLQFEILTAVKHMKHDRLTIDAYIGRAEMFVKLVDMAMQRREGQSMLEPQRFGERDGAES